jgi:type II secretory pathway predicted ATPase ExeA
MAHSRELKDALAQLELPEDREVRGRVELFMMKSGYGIRDLAASIGYSPTSLSLYLCANYNLHHDRDSNTRLIRARLTQYLDSVEFPHDELPQRPLYNTGAHAAIRKAFYRALNHRADNRGFSYCIDGGPGSGKSRIAEALVKEVGQTDERCAYYIYCGENNSPMELLKSICIEMGIPARGYIEQLVKKIQFALARKRGIIVFDEAQHLPRETVERIRQLLDRPPYIGIMFLGSHDIQRTFSDLKMEQWRRRLVATIVLPGLTEEEAEQIIVGEFGRASRKQVEYLIQASIVPDPRRPISQDNAAHTFPYERVYQGRTYEAYLSAGALFAAIDEVKLELAEAEHPQPAAAPVERLKEARA